MSARAAFWTAWSLWAVNVVVVLALFWEKPSLAMSVAVAVVLFILTFATTGALIASKLPGNPIGWLMCATALTFTVGAVSVEFPSRAVMVENGILQATIGGWVGNFVWFIGIGLAGTFLLLLFPDGRLPSRGWRTVAWMAGLGLVLFVLGVALAPGPLLGIRATNPVGIPGTGVLLDAVALVGLVLLLAGILASCASLVVRHRAAGTEQRQQLKWIAYSVPLVAAGLGASIAIELAYSSTVSTQVAYMFTSVALMALPVAIGIAILRHRLYDIDVVINKTLVYGALTVTLAVTYLGSVLLLQLALRPLTADSGLAVAGSTLAVAALFRPARSRIQAVVDRRFFRRRYDAARTLEAFGIRLRDQLDLEALGSDLRGVVRDTVQPAHVSLWLREVRR
ncbi:MAG: hypothetical protein ACRDOY_07605 [Nocardioidaceae bacterium]